MVLKTKPWCQRILFLALAVAGWHGLFLTLILTGVGAPSPSVTRPAPKLLPTALELALWMLPAAPIGLLVGDFFSGDSAVESRVATAEEADVDVEAEVR